MKITIPILYSCPACGLKDVEVQVRAREAGQDVAEWMDRAVVVECGADHFHRSPGCAPASLRDIKIPIAGAPFIGAPVRH